MAYFDLATDNAAAATRLTRLPKDLAVMSNTPLVQAFWRSCAAQVGLDDSTPYTVKVYGNNPDMATLLMGLVSSGQKTGTFTLVWEYEDKGEPLPARGDWVVVTDTEGAPGCVYQITATEIVPFNQMEDRHVQCEGPQLREIEAWSNLHWEFWSQQLAGSNRIPDRSMPVLCLSFKVHYPPIPTAD